MWVKWSVSVVKGTKRQMTCATQFARTDTTESCKTVGASVPLDSKAAVPFAKSPRPLVVGGERTSTVPIAKSGVFSGTRSVLRATMPKAAACVLPTVPTVWQMWVSSARKSLSHETPPST